jgi:hypothetical protein
VKVTTAVVLVAVDSVNNDEKATEECQRVARAETSRRKVELTMRGSRGRDRRQERVESQDCRKTEGCEEQKRESSGPGHWNVPGSC